MKISTSDYETTRSLFDLCDWITQKVSELVESSDNGDAYFRQRGNIKKLLEEAIPISYFGLHLYRIRRNINVTCHAGNEPYDGKIEIEEQWDIKKKTTIFVEVTSTESDKTALQREYLANEGIVNLSDDLERDEKTRKIIPIRNNTLVNIDIEQQKVIDEAYKRSIKKLEKKDNLGNFRYTSNTAIIIYVTYGFPLSPRFRINLLNMTLEYLKKERPTVYGVYYCYKADGTIDGIRNDHRVYTS